MIELFSRSQPAALGDQSVDPRKVIAVEARRQAKFTQGALGAAAANLVNADGSVGGRHCDYPVFTTSKHSTAGRHTAWY